MDRPKLFWSLRRTRHKNTDNQIRQVKLVNILFIALIRNFVKIQSRNFGIGVGSGEQDTNKVCANNCTFGDNVQCVCVCVHVTQSNVQGEELEAVLTSFCVIIYRESK